MLVKNEADIVAYCLNEAKRWSDFIYVYDNGSDDGTWEIVQSMRSEQIIPFKQDGKPFHDGLRSEVFNRYKERAKKGDWWCRLDSHDVYLDDPRAFLAQVSPRRHAVWGLFIQYYVTLEDVHEIDFSLPCDQVLPMLRYYNCNYSELRFCRHRDRLIWTEKASWPRHLGVTNERLIRFKHYPYRSPAQVQKRLDIRKLARDRGSTLGSWELPGDKIGPRSALEFDKNDGHYVIDPAILRVHLGPNYRRLIQSFLHATGIWP